VRSGHYAVATGKLVILWVMESTDIEALRVGLCASCEFVQRIVSAKGSTFFLCQKSFSDPAFPKYPRVPVVRCAGYVAVSASDNG